MAGLEILLIYKFIEAKKEAKVDPSLLCRDNIFVDIEIEISIVFAKQFSHPNNWSREVF